MRDVAVVVVSYNTRDMLRDCLTAIQSKGGASTREVIVVDNASDDGSPAMVLREFPDVHLLAQSENLGFGAANNIGVAAATAPFVMLLNSDAILLEDTGAGLAAYLRAHGDVVCVGPGVLLPNGSPQPRVFGHQPSMWRLAMQALPLGALFGGPPWLEGTDGGPRYVAEERVGWISGVCMMMRRDDFLATGGFDAHIFMYCEDIDLCARVAQRGGAVVRLNRFAVRHFGGASSPTPAAQIRSALWVQRNLLYIVKGRAGIGGVAGARALMFCGLTLRLFASVARVPSRGVKTNMLLRTSWSRMRDLLLPRS